MGLGYLCSKNPRMQVWGFGGAGTCKWVPVLQVKPKLPGVKSGSCRFPDVMGGMDNGFSPCAVPAFCRGPGILDICRYMHGHREVVELKDVVGRFLVAHGVE